MSTDDSLARALRSRGLRVTQQREQVLAAVRRLGHATPEEISSAVDDVDLATVYRTLQLLEDINLVAHTHLGHGAPSYQPADEVHIHVVCHGCGAVLPTPPGLAEPIVRRLREEREFSVDLAHLTIFGHCADCVRAGVTTSTHGRSEHEHDHDDHDHAEQTKAGQR